MMGFYKLREDYNKAFAEAHPDVLHNQPVSGDDERPRHSFFRVNDEEELQAASANWIHYPLVVMTGLVGGLVNKNSSIRQLNINTLMFLTKIAPDPANPIVAAAITEAYDITFELMNDYIKQVKDDYEEDPTCGTFRDIDPGKFKWQQEGPIGDQFYGWLLTFSDETKPRL